MNIAFPAHKHRRRRIVFQGEIIDRLDHQHLDVVGRKEYSRDFVENDLPEKLKCKAVSLHCHTKVICALTEM